MLWQRFVRSNTATGAPGEVLFDVAELSSGTLIAVGGASFASNASKSLICSFSAGGTLNYIETRDRSNGDNFISVCAASNDAIISGWYDGPTYKDSRVMRYRPGATSGTVIWDNSYDVSGVSDAFGNSLVSDGIQKVFVRGGKVVASASAAETWSTVPNIHTAFQCDLATGGNAAIRGLLNKKYTYANNTAFYPVDSSTIYVAQNPADSFQDAVLWTSPSFTNGLISKIRPFNATGQVLAAREFNLAGSQSIFSMDYYASALFMTGCSNAGSVTVNNDIYFVISMSSLNNPNRTCDLIDDSFWVTSPALVAQTQSETIAYPTNTGTKTLTFSNPGLVSSKTCGEVVVLSRTTGMPAEYLAGNDFTLFPNPAANSVTLELKGAASACDVAVQIMNVIGQLVYTGTASFDASGSATLNTASLTPGSYFLRLSSNNQIFGTRLMAVAR